MRNLAVLALLALTGCIPEHVLDADWCRSMQAASVSADQRGKSNLSRAMTLHHCDAKLAHDEARRGEHR